MAIFTSYDGADGAGVRAEVLVTENTGKITSINERDKSAEVLMAVPGFKHAERGWIRRDDPLFAVIKEAHEAEKDITIHIEAQRKPGVDRKTPMKELRTSSDVARENITKIIARVNGELTEEAVTSPDEDHLAEGSHVRHAARSGGNSAPATPAPTRPANTPNVQLLRQAIESGLPQGVISSLAANMIASGIALADVNAAFYGRTTAANSNAPAQASSSRAFAREEAPYKQYNSDGRLNLGSTSVMAGISSEKVAVDLLRKAGVTELLVQPPLYSEVSRQVGNLAAVLLSMADVLQVYGYGEGAVPNRMDASHTRARGVIYDTIEAGVPLQAKDLDENGSVRREWVDTVLGVAKQRFFVGVKVSTTNHYLPRPEADQQAQNQKQAPSQQRQTAPQDQPQEPKQAEAPRPDQSPQSAPQAPPAPSASPDAPTQPQPPEGLFPPRLSFDPNAPKANDETAQMIQEFVHAADMDVRLFQDLLMFTFGKSMVRDVPLDDMEDFLDHYVGVGDEATIEAAQYARAVIGGRV